MNGIDISSHQTGIDLTKVPCDFVIIKATQGTKYVNPDMDRTVKQAVAKKKLIGFYHYASSGGAVKEAAHFLRTIPDVDAILVLDWESYDNKNWGNVKYAKEFLDYILKKTGKIPFIYMSKSVCRSYDWSNVASYYPLWVAQYKNYNYTAYQMEPWTDQYSYGAWKAPLIFQYSSAGRLAGWNGNLDLNISYMDAKTWNAYAKGKAKVPDVNKVDTSDYPLIGFGAKGPYVELLQNALTLRGFPCNPDGIFGNETKNGVMAFQKSMGISVDGIVGPVTWDYIFNH